MKTPSLIEPNLWSGDHFSLLLFIETRVVDYAGELDTKYMRKHRPELQNKSGWTRLRDGSQVENHFDIDCLDDFEEAGLIKNIGTGLYPKVKLTELGWKIAHKLRKMRANGEDYSNLNIYEI